MDFSLTDEQKMLKESAERFIERDYTFAARRELAAGELGFGRENWARFAELGWLAVALPEAHGGLGGSLLDVAVLMEAFGRGLVVEPYVPSVVLGGGLVALAGAEAQKDALLPPLAEGRLMLALAHGEPQSRFNLADVETTAKETTSGDGGYVLDGHKCVVLNAAAADRIVVSARTSGAARQPDGITLFLVDRQADGVVLRPYATQDGRRAAEVGLVGVRVGSGDVLGAVGGGLLAGSLGGLLAGLALGKAHILIHAQGAPAVCWSPTFLTAFSRYALLTYITAAHFGRGRGQFKELGEGCTETHQPWIEAVELALEAQAARFSAQWEALAGLREELEEAGDDESRAAIRVRLEQALTPIFSEGLRMVLIRLYPGAEALMREEIGSVTG